MVLIKQTGPLKPMPNPQSTCAMQHAVQFVGSCTCRHITSCRTLVGTQTGTLNSPRRCSRHIPTTYTFSEAYSHRGPKEAKKALHTTIILAHAHPIDITFRRHSVKPSPPCTLVYHPPGTTGQQHTTQRGPIPKLVTTNAASQPLILCGHACIAHPGGCPLIVNRHNITAMLRASTQKGHQPTSSHAVLWLAAMGPCAPHSMLTNTSHASMILYQPATAQGYSLPPYTQ